MRAGTLWLLCVRFALGGPARLYWVSGPVSGRNTHPVPPYRQSSNAPNKWQEELTTYVCEPLAGAAFTCTDWSTCGNCPAMCRVTQILNEPVAMCCCCGMIYQLDWAAAPGSDVSQVEGSQGVAPVACVMYIHAALVFAAN